MQTTTSIRLAETQALTDWETFASRAHRIDESGAMRLSATGDVLVVSVAPLYPHGLGDATPLTVGTRMFRLSDTGLDGLDVVVPTVAICDRFARLRSTGEESMPIPPQEIQVAWAGIAPPRGPWMPVGELADAELITAAEAGIAEVAAGTPQMAGIHAVTGLRRRVWGRPLPGAFEDRLPAAVAFAMYGLGFAHPAGMTSVFEAPGWLRLSSPRGHVLTRGRGDRTA
ncbi:hypothetical protein [Brevibacterium otitidis]|uniref:Uncharacterized protein n=1 Tax=Brevibacterium otitidis TaxID=53364 RepID=A0ABV5X5D0_9MICO|nr:hypothetical protein GCM10023233_15180 [Brevibacterium otitidis]